MDCYIYNSFENFEIGKNTIINRECILDRRGGLLIGSNVNISQQVAIYTAGHNINSNSFQDYLKPVHINDYVWLGTRCIIMPGVKIGKGAVVLPGSIVVKDIEPYMIVGGIPGKVIGNRMSDLDYNPEWRPLFQ